MKRLIYIYVVIFASGLISVSCKKYVNVGTPSTLLTADAVFSQDATATAVITQVYADMANSSMISGYSSMSAILGLCSDELAVLDGQTTTGLLSSYNNNISTSNGPSYWGYYSYIYTANTVISGVNQYGETLTPAVKLQLLGEAKFVRAFCYFYLVNLYGDVPLATTTNYTINAFLPKTDKNLVYDQIIQDLTDAEQLLSSGYLDVSLTKASTERIRPTKWAAKALLARVYLYVKDYAKADQKVSNILDSSSLYRLTSLDSVFFKNSAEAIWQLQPVTTGINTNEAMVFILPSSGPTTSSGYPYFLDTLLVNSIYNGDKRKSKWMNNIVVSGMTYYYPWKYKATTTGSGSVSEYAMVLRLAECFLISAEARARLGDVQGALGRLNAVRSRASVLNVVNLNQQQLLDTILHEKQIELFSESGHRWLDLKRTGRVDSVMNIVTPLKGTYSWRSYQQLLPIPAGELIYNTNLIQNTGY